MTWKELKEKMLSVGFITITWPGPPENTRLGFGPKMQPGFLFQMGGEMDSEIPNETIRREIENMGGRFKDEPGSKELLKILESAL